MSGPEYPLPTIQTRVEVAVRMPVQYGEDLAHKAGNMEHCVQETLRKAAGPNTEIVVRALSVTVEPGDDPPFEPCGLGVCCMNDGHEGECQQ